MPTVVDRARDRPEACRVPVFNGAAAARLVAALAVLLLAGCGESSGPILEVGSSGDSTLTWYAGDTHVHTRGCGGNLTAAEMVALLLHEAIDVGSALIWGPSWSAEASRFTGKDDPASLPGLILRYDVEVSGFPASKMSHLNLLGLSSRDFSPTPTSTPLSGVPIIDWALANNPGVLIGSSHLQMWPADGSYPGVNYSCCTAFEFPIHVARDRMAFLEMEWRSDGALLLWRTLLNSGFEMPLVGASDYPCLNNQVGEPRTHVLVDGKLSYEAFLEGIRLGRTVVIGGAAGHADLRVNGARLGENVAAAAGESLRVSVTTDLVAGGQVKLLVNGVAVDMAAAGAGPDELEFQLTLNSSAWIAASVDVDSQRWVQTGAIYVIVDESPIRASAADACYLVRYVDYLEQTLVPALGRGATPFGADTAAVFAAYAEARAVFMQRFVEAGGTTCL